MCYNLLGEVIIMSTYYCITGVRYDPITLLIDKLRGSITSKDLSLFLPCQDLNRQEVLSKIITGDVLYILNKTKRQEHIHLIEIENSLFLRHDWIIVAMDDLGDLPDF